MTGLSSGPHAGTELTLGILSLCCLCLLPVRLLLVTNKSTNPPTPSYSIDTHRAVPAPVRSVIQQHEEKGTVQNLPLKIPALCSTPWKGSSIMQKQSG